MPESRTLVYTLRASASGVEAIRAVRREIEAIAAVRFNFDAQVATLREVAQAAAASSIAFQNSEKGKKQAADASTTSIKTQVLALNQLTTALNASGRAGSIKISLSGGQQAINDVRTLQGIITSLQASSNLRITTDVTALQAVNATIAAQITQLTALIAQLRSLGPGPGPGPGPAGGAAGLPAGVRATILEIERLNQLFTRGQISGQNYSMALTAMQGRLEGARAAAGRGTEEFAAIDKQITKLTQSLRGINTDSLTKIRTDMAGVRTAFDSATAGVSRNSQQFRDAAAAYQTGAAGIEARLRAMAAQGNLTAQQMGNVNRMLGTLAREQGTLTGGLNPMGLSGNIFNALRAGFPIIQQMGGSLGAAAMNGSMAAQAFSGAGAAAGVMGVAVLGAAAVVAGISLAAMNTVKTFSNFEHAMQGVKAVSDTTGKVFDGLKGQAMLLGREFGVSLETVAQAQEELYKAGRTTEDITGGAAKGVILLAAATGTDLLNAVNIANSAMNVFGLKGSDMITVADTISNGANKTALDVNTLGVSLQQVGNVAASSGLSLQETVAVLGMMADKGMAGSDAGTSLKVMLQRLKAPTDEANNALKMHGVAVYDASGKQRNMMDILKDTIGSMNHMTDAQRNAFAQTVFGTDAVRAITVMYSNGAVKLDEYVDSMNEKGGAERNAITRLDDLEGAQKKVNVSLQIFKTNIGEYFAPGMKDFLAELQKGIDGLNDFFNLLQNKPSTAFKDLDGWLKETGQSMGNLTEAERKQAQTLLDKQNAIGRELGVSVKLVELNPMLTNDGKKAVIERLNKAAAEAVALVVAELAGIQKGASTAGRAVTGSLLRALPGASQGLAADGSGLGLANGLGLNATRRGTPFGGTYFGNKIHNGEDFFAPTGTPLSAPFAGYVTTRTTKTTGKIVELIDSVGNKLLLGHLDAFANGLESRIKAANGRLMISKGEMVGTVGQTGTLAHKDLGPGNAHVHAMGYMAGSNAPVSPFSVPFQDQEMPYAPPTVLPGAETAAQQARAKGLSAYINEVTRLQTAIDKAAKQGLPGLPAWEKATAALRAFTESNKDMVAQANEWISTQTKATKAALKDFGLSDDDWAKYKKRATDLAQLQADQQAGKLGEKASLAATQSLASFNSDPVKAKALAFAAAELTRQKSQDSQTLQQQRDAAAESSRVTKATTAQRVADAQAEVQRLEGVQSDAIEAAGDNQAERLAAVKKNSQAIFEARELAARAIRKGARDDAADEKNPGLKAAQIEAANSKYLRDVELARTERIRAVNAAEKTAETQTAADLKKTEADKLKQLKEAQGVTQALRSQDVEKATQHLDALKRLRDAALKDAGQNVSKQLAVQEQYRADLEAGGLAIAAAQYKIDKAAALSGPIQLKDGAIQIANAKRDAAVAAATDPAAITTATEAQTSAIKAQRTAYSGIADTLRQSIKDGNLDAEARQKVVEALNEQHDAAQKLGILENKNIIPARDTVRALLAEADGAYQATTAYEAYWKVRGEQQNNEGMADAGMRGSFGVGQNGLDAALMGSGANRKLLGDPQAALADLEKFNKDVADRIRRVYADELAQFQNYHDAVNAGVLETVTAAYAQIRQAAADEQAAADDASTTVDSLATMLQGVLANGLDPQTSGYVLLLDEIIAKGGQAGEAAKYVKENLDLLTSLQLAPSLQGILDNPSSVQDGAGDKSAGAPGPSVIAALQGQLDSQRAAGIKELTDAELAARQATDELNDDGKDLANVLGEIENRAQAAKTALEGLPTVKAQLALSALDRQHAAGEIGDYGYANQKESRQTDLENAQYALSSAKLLGPALETAKLQHEDRLTQIHADGELARKAVTDKFAQDQKEASAKAVADTEAFMSAQAQVGQAEQQLSQAMGAKAELYTNEIEGLEKLKTQYPALADRIALVITAYQKLRQLGSPFAKFQEYAGYVRDLAGALGGLAEAAGASDLAANLNGVANLAGKLMDLGTDVARIVANPADIGAWVGAITKVIGGISEAIGGFTKAKAEALQKQTDFNDSMTLINGNDYSKTFTRSRGFFGDLFGGGPEVVQEIDKVGLRYAKTLESSILSGVSGGMKDALAKNDFSLFKKGMQASIYDGIVQGMIDGFQTEVIKTIMAPAIKEFSDAMKTPGTADDDLAIEHIDHAIDNANTAGRIFYDRVTPLLSRIRPPDEAGTGGSTDTGTSFGAVASSGQVVMGTQFYDAGMLFDAATRRFDSTIGRAESMFADVSVVFREVMRDGFHVGVDVQTSGGASGNGSGLSASSLR